MVTAPSRPSAAAAVTPAEKVRRAARRFAAGRLAQMEAESPLSAEERAQWRELVRRHATQAADAARPMPLPAQESSTERPLPDSGALAAAAAAAGVAGPQPNATGVLSGRITSAATGTGISGAAVMVYLGYGYLTLAYADATGNYSFTGLASGAYYVKTNNFDGYIDEAWNNFPCDWNCNPRSSGAASIAVTDGATTSGIDFALDRGGRITGTVVNAVTSAPIANLGLTVKNATGRSVTYAYTDAAGVFTSYGGLVSGTYLVRTNTSWTSQGFVDEVYNNLPCALSACSPIAGTPIAVASPSTTGGVDFALDPGGGLAGRVTSAGTSAGLSGVRVRILLLGSSLGSPGRPMPPATGRRARTSRPAPTRPSHRTTWATSTRSGTTSPAPAARRGPAGARASGRRSPSPAGR